MQRRGWQRVRAELKKAGIDRSRHPDQQRSASIPINVYYENNQPPKLTGYNASNQPDRALSRGLAQSGTILDALVAVGANQISGPNPGHSTIPTRRSTKRAPRRSPWAAPGPSFMRGRWGCASSRIVAVSESARQLCAAAGAADANGDDAR